MVQKVKHPGWRAVPKWIPVVIVLIVAFLVVSLGVMGHHWKLLASLIIYMVIGVAVAGGIGLIGRWIRHGGSNRGTRNGKRI